MDYTKCMICPRECGANRTEGVGYCRAPSEITISRAALHYWEEPCISGENGSGAVFFCGCQMGCVYCQNKKIAHCEVGAKISDSRLYDIFFELKEKGAHNINLVTPDCYYPRLIPIIARAKKDGLDLPFICNCSGYEKVEMIHSLGGVIDIWLPDFKYTDTVIANKYSFAKDYPEVAKKAIDEMVKLCPTPVFDRDGMMKSGVIVRHLVLPHNYEQSRTAIEYLYRKYGENIYYSIMSQFTPINKCDYPELNEKIDRIEYDRIVDFALGLGMENAYIQDEESIDESFVPEWNMEGVFSDCNDNIKN